MRRLVPLAAFALVALLPVGRPVPAAAEREGGPIVVDTADDTVAADGFTSLREALSTANANGVVDVIQVQSGLNIELDLCGANTPEDLNASGDLDHTATDALTISSPGGATITQTCVGERVLQTSSPTTLTGLTLTGGDNDVIGGLDGVGGGVYATGGALTLSESRIVGNHGTQGGGIFATDLVALERSEVSDNTASSTVGGIYGNDSANGITLDRSTVSGNTAPGRAALLSSEDLVMTNSTVTGNTNTSNNPGTVTVNVVGDVTATHSVVARNVSPDGIDLETGGALTTTASAIGQPAGPGAANVIACNVQGGTTSNGHNLGTDATCGFTATTDTQVTDLRLGPLQENGGPTRTHLPARLSPLTRAIPSVDCTTPIDQRGIVRPTNGRCEIGPVETVFRPDALIGIGVSGLAGQDVYGPAGPQTKAVDRGRGTPARFAVRVGNDGELADVVRVHGPGSDANFTVRYFRSGLAVTPQVTGAGKALVVPAGGIQSLTMEVTAKPGAPIGSRFQGVVRAVSSTGTTDRVGANVRVVP